MAKEKKIQDYDAMYSILRYYVDFVLKLSYRTIKYIGRETIPTDGAVIYAPNHTNALMDALVILAMDHKPKVFVARADIFRNPKLAKILTWLKIMPIMRMRDGYEEVKKNNQTIEKAVDVLRDKVPFCIFPEGTHQAKYSTLPLSKGIFRIAMQAHELMPDMPLYIVPVGVRYGNFFRFRSTVRVQIGEVINVGDFVDKHGQLSVVEQMNEMRVLLDERMKDSIFYIPNDEDYDAIYEICAVVVKQKSKQSKKHGLEAHFEINKQTVSEILRMKEQKPEAAELLLALGSEASEIRKRHKISLSSVSVKYPFISRLLMVLFFLITLPYTIVASVLTLPIKGVCGYLFTKLKDYAFRNSIRYFINLILWPVLMIIYSIVAYLVLPWWLALPITISLLPAPIVAHEVYRIIRLMVSDIKLLNNRELREKYEQIRNMVFNA